MERNKKVLIVDDDVHVRRVIHVKLKSQGYEVIMARDGEEGLRMINEEKPDAVITDINMPKLDGEALVKQSNELKKERPFLTIVMTARISPQEQKWVDQMQDTQLMQKPFSPNMMLKTLNNYFGKD
ncbi:MAG: response regulator [Pseudomonadota bacterium]